MVDPPQCQERFHWDTIKTVTYSGFMPVVWISICVLSYVGSFLLIYMIESSSYYHSIIKSCIMCIVIGSTFTSLVMCCAAAEVSCKKYQDGHETIDVQCFHVVRTHTKFIEIEGKCDSCGPFGSGIGSLPPDALPIDIVFLPGSNQRPGAPPPPPVQQPTPTPTPIVPIDVVTSPMTPDRHHDPPAQRPQAHQPPTAQKPLTHEVLHTLWVASPTIPGEVLSP